MDFIKHYVMAAVLFVAIDAVWLSVVANKFYKKELGHMLAKKPNLVAAAVFYVIYMAAIVIFVVDPALEEQTLGYVLGHGALLGAAMYATYDLTNHATLKDWPSKITYVDMVWGTTITTLVSTLTYLIFK